MWLLKDTKARRYLNYRAYRITLVAYIFALVYYFIANGGSNFDFAVDGLVVAGYIVPFLISIYYFMAAKRFYLQPASQ